MSPSFNSFSKRLIALFLVVFFGALFFACSQKTDTGSDQPLLNQIEHRGKLIAGVKYDMKPFGYLDKDARLQGFDVDLMHELAKRLLGKSDAVEFQQVLSSTRMIALNFGHLDIVAATMTITPEREEVVDFSEVYFVARQGVIVPRKSKFQTLNDLEKARVLYVIGSTSEKNIKEKLPEAEYFGFKSAVEAFSALKAGRGDAMTTDDTILYGFLADSGCDFRLLPERLSEEPYGLGIRQDDSNKNTRSFKLRVNEVLREMKADGTLDKLKAKWVTPYENLKACS